MAITRTTDGTLVVGNPFTGERAIALSEVVDTHNIAVIDWLEEGVGMGVTLDEAVAIRDELDLFITRARNAGKA